MNLRQSVNLLDFTSCVCPLTENTSPVLYLIQIDISSVMSLRLTELALSASVIRHGAIGLTLVTILTI